MRLHPKHAVSYFQGHNKRANAIPAIVLLLIALMVLMTLRRGTLPTSPSEVLTLAGGATIVVVLGTLVPSIVVLALVALLAAAVLGTPQLASGLTAANKVVSDITRLP